MVAGTLLKFKRRLKKDLSGWAKKGKPLWKIRSRIFLKRSNGRQRSSWRFFYSW